MKLSLLPVPPGNAWLCWVAGTFPLIAILLAFDKRVILYPPVATPELKSSMPVFRFGSVFIFIPSGGYGGFAVLVYSVVELFPHALDLMYVSSIRQLLLTQRLWLRAILSISGKNRIVHRSIEEWSTGTLPSSIISSMCR